MKKCLLALALICGFTTMASAQNVVIQQNTTSPSSSSQTTGHGYYINGISTAEDIGGVDVEFVETWVKEGNTVGREHYLQFTNYHNATVTVLFELEVWNGREVGNTYGSITLRANETKKTPNSYWTSSKKKIVMIVRKL